MKKLALISLILLVARVSFAGAFVEPYLGYETGTMKGTYAAGGTFDSTIKGEALGIRLGYKFLIPWIAFDAKYFVGSDDSNPSNDITRTDLGITVGLGSLPIVRPYVGYNFSTKEKYKSSLSNATLNGDSFKVGVGFKILPLVDVNLDYNKFTFKDSSGTDINQVFSDYKRESYMLSVSYTF